jgi:hypothetical protein
LKHHRIPLDWSELSSAVVQSLLIVLIGIFTGFTSGKIEQGGIMPFK